MKKLIVVFGIAAAFTQAHAINKCVDASGKIVFQDTECAGAGEKIKVRPSGGEASPTPSAVPPAPAATSGKSGTEKLYETMRDERVRREKWVVMNDSKVALDRIRQGCENEQARLEASKVLSKNNLAGATRDSSISQQMQAAATMCDQRLRSQEKVVSDTEKVCAEIKCIPAF